MVRWRVVVPVALAGFVAATWWLLHVQQVGHWLQVHLGIVDEPGPYYGFWSGFGSDIAEFGILGALATAVYQMVRRYNCRYPGCWRIGIHPAAGGQLMLCYRHHPDLAGMKLSQALILDLHQQHRDSQTDLRARVDALSEQLRSGAATAAADRPDH
jgi:hypothetical protein